MAEQEQGCYPRLNGAMLQSGAFANQIVSVVGVVVSFDGVTLQIKASDGIVVLCLADEVTAIPGTVIEAIGANGEDGTLQLFVTREFQGGADMEVYNRMIKEVILNPKFSEYFGSSLGVIPMRIGQ